MKAKIGDRITLEGTHLGDARRVGVIAAVEHSDGTPPYTVDWQDGHRTLVFPGSDARLDSVPTGPVKS